MDDDKGFRQESDPLGTIQVPASALWGGQTQRAVGNFPVSGQRMPRQVIHAIAAIKRAAAVVNRADGRLPPPIGDAIVAAAEAVASGGHDDAFPIDVFQTGSGTSTHMNVNEVVANLANERLGGQRGSKRPVHPNDHVNLGQSSNDVFPSALHVAATRVTTEHLLPALRHLEGTLRERAAAFDHVIKIGRTHLQDALPLRLGQELGAHASLVGKAHARIEATLPGLFQLALGGTAVGTGFGAAPGFAPAVIAELARTTGLPFAQAPDLFEALAGREAIVALSAALRGAAVSLSKVANDVRWAASGPRAGLGELRLPELAPGSSLMPGKVNPVMSEMLVMVAADVIGADATIALAGASGHFQLNAMLPLLAHRTLGALEALGNAARLFADRCIAGLEADEARCATLVEASLALVTALLPRLGYDACAALAGKAAKAGKTIREICREDKLLSEDELASLLDLRAMTQASR